MRVKLFAALLMASTCLNPAPAHAGIVELIVGAISAGLNAVGVGVIGQALVGQALVGFFGFAGPALVGIAANFALSALLAPDIGAPSAPSPQEIQSNYLLEESPRYMLGGRLRIGGCGPFNEVKDGTLYKLVAHGDSEATSEIALYLNDIAVTLNGSNYVTDDEFVSRGAPFFKLEKRAGTTAQASWATLQGVFTEWTATHLGAGVCDTLMTVPPVPVEDRTRILRHRGVLGLGEPDVTRAAWYGRYYDPRNDSTNGGSGTERVNDSSTWGPNLGNAALFFATHRIDPERFANDPDDINWANIAAQADICGATVVDHFGGSAMRYEVALAINKDQHNNKQAEDWILAACDGVTWTDDEGRIGLYVGYFDADPDLVLTDEDISGDIESSDNNDGEGLSTHYLGSYTEPNFAFKATQAEPVVSPDYTIADAIRTKKVDLYQVPNHNQTFRLLSAAVARNHERRRVAVIAGLKGLKAKQRRFLRLDLASDPALSGIYEVSPGSDSYGGVSIPLLLIRCTADRWNAEETQRPNYDTAIDTASPLINVDPANMNVQPAQISATGGTSAVRLAATFTPPTRADVLVQIQHREQSSGEWEEFIVKTTDGYGYSAIVSDGSIHEYRWRVYTVTGILSAWEEFVTGSTPYTVTATADTTPPDDLSATSADDATPGQVTYHWTAPVSLNYYATRLYRATGAAAAFGSAVALPLQTGLPGDARSYTESLAADDYRVWMEPLNGSLAAGTRVGPIDFTVT